MPEHRPLSAPPRPVVPPAPVLDQGKCSDCQEPAIPAADGFFQICPKCCAVLWSGVAEYNDMRKAEIARQRKAAAEAAARVRQETWEKKRMEREQLRQLRRLHRQPADPLATPPELPAPPDTTEHEG